MSRTTLAALTLLAIAGCGRGDKSEVASADSLNRDLQLAPVDTSAALNDQPADTVATPAPAPAPTPKPAAPKPKPKAAAPAPAPAPATPAPAPAPAPAATGLASGTTFSAATDAKDAAGRVVIPAGSQVTLQVTAIKESENKGDTTGTLTLKPVSIAINGASQPLAASISGVKPKL